MLARLAERRAEDLAARVRISLARVEAAELRQARVGAPGVDSTVRPRAAQADERDRVADEHEADTGHETR